MNEEKELTVNNFIKRVVPEGTFLNHSASGERSSFLSDGIININKKIFLPNDNSPAILNVFYTDGSKNIGRELYTRHLMKSTSVPTQRLIEHGKSSIFAGRDSGFLIKEYKFGKTLDEVLTNHSREHLNQTDFASVLSDLGLYLGQINSVILPAFGKIENFNIIGPYNQCTWKDYYLYRLYQRMTKLESLPQDKKVGNFTVKDITNLLPKLFANTHSYLPVLEQVSTPHLTHGDFHFLNIIASKKDGKWSISGILDLENMIAADPEVDLISIESQMNLSPAYRDLFMNNLNYFKNSYNRPISKHYQEKRWLYHLTWSLSYFEAIMQMDTDLHPVTSPINYYMKKHFEVLEKLSCNKKINDIGIPSLY